MSKIISINGGALGGASLPPRNGSGHVEHTPAPWKASKGHDGEPDRWCVVADREKQYLIAVIENGQPGDCCETEGATARVIAAAPEMLAALIELRDWYLQHVGLPAVKANAAIAKASVQNESSSATAADGNGG